MNRIELRVAGLLALLLVLGTAGPMTQPAWAAAAPTVSVSGVAITAGNDVTAGGPVCSANSTGSVSVAATVAATFDTNSGPTQLSSSCAQCKPGTTAGGNNNCDTGNTAVNSKLTVVTRTKAYTDKKVLGSASDNNGASNTPAFDVGTTSGVGNFGTLPNGPEGKTTVTAAAIASELETQTDTTTITFWSGGPTGPTACTGTNPVAGPTPTSVDTLTTKTSNSSSANGSYLVDLIAPTMRVASYSPNPGPDEIPTITAGSSVGLNTRLKNGSAETSYDFDLEAYNFDNDLGVQNFGAFSFGSSPDGIDSNENNNSRDLLYQTQCETPPGVYFMKATANAVDLCGNNNFPLNLNDPLFLQQDPAKTRKANSPFDVGGNNESGTFEVLPAVELSTVTHLIGPLPPNGQYDFLQCFTTKGNPRKIIVNPGSAHVAAIVNSTVLGTCEVSTITNPTVKLTLPTGFSFLLTGGSPPAHVFVGDAVGFDLHNPELNGFAEVTDAALISGQFTQTITVDLSNVDVGFGPGQIPTSDTIYVRAHMFYSGSDPSPHGQFEFLTEAGIGGVISASDTEKLHANPAGCTPDGLLP